MLSPISPSGQRAAPSWASDAASTPPVLTVVVSLTPTAVDALALDTTVCVTSTGVGAAEACTALAATVVGAGMVGLGMIASTVPCHRPPHSTLIQPNVVLAPLGATAGRFPR